MFFDSAYIKSASVPDPSLLSRYFVNRGYKLLDEKALGEFLQARIADKAPSVLVFAIDHLPPNGGGHRRVRALAAAALSRCGREGRVAGDSTGALSARPEDRQCPAVSSALKWDNATKLLGVPHEAAMFDQRGVRATDAGKRWGLQQRWRTGWGIDPGQVDHRARPG